MAKEKNVHHTQLPMIPALRYDTNGAGYGVAQAVDSVVVNSIVDLQVDVLGVLVQGIVRPFREFSAGLASSVRSEPGREARETAKATAGSRCRWRDSRACLRLPY